MSAKQTSESFWAKVDIRGDDDCWEWLGARNNTGYGTVAWHGKVYTSHRVSAVLSGLVDDMAAPEQKSTKRHVLHKCDNRACCNPSHFFLGSYSDNQLDAYRKRRREQPKGSRHTNAKFTDEQIAEIKRMYYAGQYQQTIADVYGVSQTTISAILRKKTYK